jgi:hypothetical protein
LNNVSLRSAATDGGVPNLRGFFLRDFGLLGYIKVAWADKKFRITISMRKDLYR